MIKICWEISRINNFQWQSSSGICLEDNCEIIFEIDIYLLYAFYNFTISAASPQLTFLHTIWKSHLFFRHGLSICARTVRHIKITLMKAIREVS